MKWIKPVLLSLVAVFALFYLITYPENAANAVQGAVDAVFTGVQAVGRFFSSLAT